VLKIWRCFAKKILGGLFDLLNVHLNAVLLRNVLGDKSYCPLYYIMYSDQFWLCYVIKFTRRWKTFDATVSPRRGFCPFLTNHFLTPDGINFLTADAISLGQKSRWHQFLWQQMDQFFDSRCHQYWVKKSRWYQFFDGRWHQFFDSRWHWYWVKKADDISFFWQQQKSTEAPHPQSTYPNLRSHWVRERMREKLKFVCLIFWKFRLMNLLWANITFCYF